MPVIAADLGGTKLALAVVTAQAELLLQKEILLNKETDAGDTVCNAIAGLLEETASLNIPVAGVGICVPGIYRRSEKTVWAPNIPGWDNYPLYNKIKAVTGRRPLYIESDRSCYIMGEQWQGAAKGCTDAIYLAIGTGIGAGILSEGRILKGANDIAGAVGWLTAEGPVHGSSNLEAFASGEGIARTAGELLATENTYTGALREKSPDTLTAHDVFAAYENNDALARKVLAQSIVLWGKAAANLISIFNPQKIIFGGGVFGPAIRFIPAIADETKKWAQPVSMQQVSIEASALGKAAGLYGAGLLALQSLD